MKATGGRFKKVLAACCAAALVACMAAAATGCTSNSGSSSASASGSAASASASSASASASSASSQAATRIFTDSLGREVEIPVELTKIVPSGHTANQVLLTMAPEKMVGLSQAMTDEQAKYLGVEMQNLPILGAIFGNKGDMNKEEVAATGCQIIIDTGEPKSGMKEDLDALQEQLGIPCVHITTTLDSWGTAYRMLGDLLGMPERGEALGAYCDAAYAEAVKTQSNLADDKRVNMAYLCGDAGLNAIAKGSYQGAIIDMFANNVVVVEKASGSGLGNEISLEQIAVWNPDLIVFQEGSIYNTAADEAAWSGNAAIANKNYYEVPGQPYCWLNNPPTVNQILGMRWLPRLLYPDMYDDDMKDVVCGYYSLFYGYNLTDDEYAALIAHAVR